MNYLKLLKFIFFKKNFKLQLFMCVHESACAVCVCATVYVRLGRIFAADLHTLR